MKSSWPLVDNSDLLNAAWHIGARLCRDAIWFQDRATWLGDAAEPAELGVRVVHRTTGGALYDGTAGIGLFLAELAAVTGDPIVARTAKGALCHASALARAPTSAMSDGFYSGRAGIATALLQSGTRLVDDEFVDRGLQLMKKVAVNALENGAADLVAGKAGIIIAVLATYRRFADASLLDAATHLGRALVAEACETPHGWCWQARRDRPGLLGLSHGVAGVVLALAELAREAKDRSYDTAIERGLAYEKAWFDADRGTWPDLREAPPEAAPGGTGLQYFEAWCHGAPGISLARARLWQLSGLASARQEALQAIVATEKAIERALQTNGNFSLCHGLTGNAEALVVARQLLAERPSAAPTEPVAQELVEQTLEQPQRVVGGLPGDDAYAPGLMLGSAGMGHFLLRQMDRSGIPTVLLPGLPAIGD